MGKEFPTFIVRVRSAENVERCGKRDRGWWDKISLTVVFDWAKIKKEIEEVNGRKGK